jgi:23S rRNA (cytidine1920-2'-O)/16S rRNA (cytidine1409-2'-O)-methyltransferase
MKKRIDILLAESGVCRSRSEAKDLVGRRLVEVDGAVVDKVSREFEEEDFKKMVREKKVRVLVDQYVGRGAYKLLYALEHFQIDVKNKVCLDIGSSTGGFTEVLLRRGASRVYAVDVGSEQFDRKLLQEFVSKIVLQEQTDVRNWEVVEQVDLVVCDVSFISVKEIVKLLPKFLKVTGEVVVLVKPQFEVGKGELGKGGVVRDGELQKRVLREVKECVEVSDLRVEGEVESSIEGGDGNVEFLLHIML